MSLATVWRYSSGVGRPRVLAVGLAAAVLGRWAATVGHVADGLVVGALFGAVLVFVAVSGGVSLARPRVAGIAIGLAGGAALVAMAVVISPYAVGSSTHATIDVGPWAVITIVVATAEEAILRGSLFEVLTRSHGAVAAVLVTSVVFALLHVPLYGWHVVPLDLGVGLWLAGLRLISGGVAAPAVAHVVADLATWWL